MSSNRNPVHYFGAAALIAGVFGQAACTADAVPPTIDEPAPIDDLPEENEPGDDGSISPGADPDGADGPDPGPDQSGWGDNGSAPAGAQLTGNDVCGGEQIALVAGMTQVLHGDLQSANNDYASACEAESGPELVYRVDVAEAGTLNVHVEALEGQNLTMYFRQGCENPSSSLWCRNHDDAEVEESYLLAVEAGSYYLFVDTDGTQGGRYDLTLDFDTGICGDEAVNTGEDCDDGNDVQGDGCDACAFEPGSNDTCADPQNVVVAAGHSVIQGTTLGNTSQHGFDETGCQIVDTGGAPDRVIAINPSVSGSMTVNIGKDEADSGTTLCEQGANGCFSRVLHVRHAAVASEQACADVSNQIACDAAASSANGVVEEVTFNVVANETYYVFVDSYWDGLGNPSWVSGPYWLHVDLAAE